MSRDQKFLANDIPINGVTVFADRAEIRRVFDVTLIEGLNTVVVENVSQYVDSDSIRVDGKGSATIHEVKFKSEFVSEAEKDTPKVKALTKNLKELQAKRDDLEDELTLNRKKLHSLDDIIKNLGQVSLTGKDSSLITFNESVEQNLENLYEYHAKNTVELNSKIRTVQQDYNQVDEEIRSLETEISGLKIADNQKRSIYITLETYMKQTNAEIDLTYQVRNASWTPSYDIRVTTSNNNSLKLYYFGNIKQNCGEDWKDVDVMLSTIQPQCGTKLPQLGTMSVQFPAGSVDYQDQNVRIVSRKIEDIKCCPKTENNVLSTTFTVPQKKTIYSENSELKVTIVALELDPVLHFDCVPRRNFGVFLTASAINTSSYPLLAGMASVYVDSSFSAKIPLPSVYSGERFDCPLGIDPSIKVQYRPVQKYLQKSGMLNNYTMTMYEQKVTVKNGKAEEGVLVTLIDHLPKSADEKIKVKLYAPEIKPVQPYTGIGTNDDLKQLKAPEAGARLNDYHNLEWTVVLNPLEEKEYSIKYGVEIPPAEVVEYVEE
ncbi:unnamed protein product [Bursaphelenchus okinawaensis]|uniref:Mucoidy inhibitor MuiA family protein n=1 Tax=Bursaphelenchus okinawaensis TaxID=465554 RepID=A0A811KX16_9BILA|nr:unnamed protein product [Bursaphelenchus okinawaensis]CAG9113111.1 unnamed protein product [Bursaphelenchus okinawaensis]